MFIGIYGESYGWVAPDEDISGLEDEYNLAPKAMPKLIYIKHSATRDQRLTELIERIQADDTAAYLHFHSADELEDQVAGDLAMLLAERFDESRMVADSEGDGPAASLIARIPAPYTATIGRDADIAAVRDVLARGTDRVVSLIGPGGIGKSRLAIETALATEDLFPDGTYFVLLEGVLEPGLLLPTIAYHLGIRDNGEAALEERISHALADRKVLVVLDNFEQIVEAAPVLVRLYTVAPHGDVPRHEPDRPAHPRRARVRGADADDSPAGACRRASIASTRTGRGRPLRGPRAGRQARLRRDAGQRRGPGGRSAGPSKVCPWRSSSLRPRPASSRPAGSLSDSSRASPC